MNQLDTRLLQAAKSGDAASAEKALEEGADVNALDATGCTPLINAAGYGHSAIIKLLLKKRAATEIREQQIGATALIAATVSGYLEVLQLLVDSDADVNACNDDKFTALMYAAARGDDVVARFLIEKGADVNARNKFGETALMRAADRGQKKTAELLLDNKAEINLQTTTDGLTALMLAADKGYKEVAQLLINRGADPTLYSFALRDACNYARNKGFTEIEKMLQPPARKHPGGKIVQKNNVQPATANKALNAAVWKNDFTGVVRAIEEGADVNAEVDNNFPLITAAYTGVTDIVQLLVDNGADVNKKDCTDLTALAKACGAGYVDIVKILLDSGAGMSDDVLMAASIHKRPDILRLLKKNKPDTSKPNLVDGSEHTPEMLLITAAAGGDLPGVQTALAGGADINAQDVDGCTALLWASRKGFAAIVNLLLEKCCNVNACSLYKWTALMEAALNGRMEIVQLLVEHGALVNDSTTEGATPLIFAAAEGYAEIVQYLLEQGARPDVVITGGNNEGMTALKFAEKNNEPAIMRLLEKQLAVLGKQQLLFIDAAGKGDLDTVENFYKQDMDVNACNKDGETALMLAARNGHTAVARSLAEHKADVKKQTKYKWTALMEASLGGHLEIVKLLLDKGAPVNDKNSVGGTALIFASANGHTGVVQLLLETGADTQAEIKAGEHRGMTARKLAEKNHYTEILRLLE